MTAILVGRNASADSCFQKASPVEAIALSAIPIISVFPVLNVAMNQVPKMQLLALSYCQEHPNDSKCKPNPDGTVG
ncbi:hypothetical protein PN499_25955 [Kamptonema animale CS-326]|jgi:hypothetical protein|uniref:hypothetical protein n=1 Tax=Kamptonema animale TaxID=92934 RepID=UPI00232A7D6F|nr:hypothetical protein [Kamptonema animale]MDB9514650.1 hypothetical protein [Kamptonema animale CS-326]